MSRSLAVFCLLAVASTAIAQNVELSFVQASYTVTEGSELILGLTITNPQTENVTVTVASSDGTAIADGGDYTSVMQEITAVPGTNLYGVLVTALDDTQHVFDNDGLESFTVTATSAEPGTVPSTTTVVIIDRTVIVQLDGTFYSVDEGDFLDIFAEVQGDTLANLDREVVVTVTTEDDTTTGGLDYTSFSVDLTFGPGQASHILTLEALLDDDVEGQESLFISLVSVSPGVYVDFFSPLVFIDDRTGRVLEHPEDQTVPLGGTASMTCTIEAGSFISIVWSHNGVRLDADTNPTVTILESISSDTFGRGNTTSELLIDPVSFDHCGQYRCSSPEVAVDSNFASLDVEPTLELTTSGSSVTAAVETCGAVQIRIILRDASANRQVEIVTESSTSVTFSGVAPGDAKVRSVINLADGSKLRSPFTTITVA